MLHTRGVRLHAVEAGHSPDPLVVLIHGAFGGWFDFKDVIAPLAARGFHAAALDLRGFGMSDKPANQTGDTLHILAGDVAGAIQTLGGKDTVVVGADTGAIVAEAARQRYSELVSCVVALPASRGLPAAATRLPSGLLGLSDRALDALWRADFAASTSEAFRASPRGHKALELRQAARRIDHALPHIVATSRLRPLTHRGGEAPGLPHVEDPLGFVDKLASSLR